MIAEPGDGQPPRKETTLGEAIDALERLGMIHTIKPGKTETFSRWGVVVDNGGDEPVQVIVVKGV